MTGLARLLTLALSLLASPTLAAPAALRTDVPPACRGPGLDEVASAMGTAERFHFDRPMVGPFMVLLASRKVDALPSEPDGADVFARAGVPLVVAIRGRGCVLAVLLVERSELFTAMRRAVGPVA